MIALYIVGSGLLFFSSSLLTVAIATVALLFYTFIYSYLKRRFRYGTLSGGIPGSLAVLAGYTAANHAIDVRGLLLFVAINLFLAISYHSVTLKRQNDYRAANLPVIKE